MSIAKINGYELTGVVYNEPKDDGYMIPQLLGATVSDPYGGKYFLSKDCFELFLDLSCKKSGLVRLPTSYWVHKGLVKVYNISIPSSLQGDDELALEISKELKCSSIRNNWGKLKVRDWLN